MLDKLKSAWGRLKVRWHVVALAFLAALPELLNWLGVVDLRPLLSLYLPANTVDLIVGLMPFVLAFLKPMLHVVAAEDTP